ncbi:MAG: hypothetical protein JXR30_02055 [Alphaproteobacteria bacterium]|nr:hypothetical protein [Alphaproteobacteria bacterium]
MLNTVVLKFGGSAIGNDSDVSKNFHRILKHIQFYQERYQNVVVIVSALKGETRRLKDLADSLFSETAFAEKDFYMSRGETLSAQFLSQYLNSQGLQSEAMTEEKLPILTDNNYGNANILSVNTDLIQDVWNKNKVAIIPGFIGWSPEKKIATLGFEGSDTTAVYVAEALNAERCCLVKDVDGIYSADPKKIYSARKIEEISYDNMLRLANCGAKVVHQKAILFAQEKNLKIQIVSQIQNGQGTLIQATDSLNGFVGLTSDGLLISAIGIFDPNHVRVEISQEILYQKTHISIQAENEEEKENLMKFLHLRYFEN